MGRVHKKKLAEYAEAAENEEQQKKNNTSEKAGGDDDELNAAENVEDKSSTDSDVEDVPVDKSAGDGAADVAEDDEDADEFQSVHGEENEAASAAAATADKNGGGAKKTATKRKAAAKKVSDGGDAGGVTDASDDEPLNGSASSPAKRGRKAGKAKAKPAKATTGGRGRGAKKNAAAVDADDDENDDEEPEEEYEVKEILDHRVERGLTSYLIRWKGYTKDDDTWEPEDTLSCPDIIEKYKKKTSNNGTKASPKKGATPAKKGRPAGGNKATPNKQDPNKEWEVEKIIDYAEEKTGRVFRIRWKGFGPKNDTWEPEKNLYCDDLIQKFMKRMDLQQNVSFKELREVPKKTKRLVNETAPRTNYHNAIGRKSKRGVSKKRVYYGDSDE